MRDATLKGNALAAAVMMVPALLMILGLLLPGTVQKMNVGTRVVLLAVVPLVWALDYTVKRNYDLRYVKPARLLAASANEYFKKLDSFVYNFLEPLPTDDARTTQTERSAARTC